MTPAQHVRQVSLFPLVYLLTSLHAGDAWPEQAEGVVWEWGGWDWPEVVAGRDQVEVTLQRLGGVRPGPVGFLVDAVLAVETDIDKPLQEPPLTHVGTTPSDGPLDGGFDPAGGDSGPAGWEDPEEGG